MKFVETIRNIWKIDDLRQRILTTLWLIVLYRLGTTIVLPGIDPSTLSALHDQTRGGLMALLDMFSGGAFSNASVFGLGIMPYISASIVVQLMAMVVPSIQKMQREGESGRRKLGQWTRYLTIIILLIQGPVYLINLRNQLATVGVAMPSTFWFYFRSTVYMAAGSMMTLWLGERITERGVGNGVSFIILVGILARFPSAIVSEFVLRFNVSGGLFVFILELLLLLIVIIGAILLVQGTRRIPVQYAKRTVGNRMYGGARQYIPLKINAANVMPIIFAQAIMFIPLTFIGYGSNISPFWQQFMQGSGFWYNFIFALLIIVFTYFYTAVTINPGQISDDLKRSNGFIPGIKPGKATKEYIDDVMSKITLPGAIFLAIVAILPAFARLMGIDAQFSQFFGGTSLIIMVGVVLDTLQQVEGMLLQHHYDGLLEGTHIKGRNGNMYH
ncbi:preprotein translocase subunit SecY [Porphyromonas sp. HMSC065F10]|uniref:preprotein translocase subunit SecY n=1 Tax=Porphyromonas sp. HMSC065F10 TaxID=1739394 RepID=UPI0008A5B93E|nr:preprotein translocase subunit SecY [Porphyromonas sp. HMSC065F10]OFR37691.1 preprotein translocase subunit SecY [Porphyromonas sp. HMSC065F10]